ncbi:hypothetical protein Pelo_14483 [Pelomyxa schiedti]|nr:hypothetical protein Pelo_14483 [Pelomyxa schiedti]
MRVDVLVGIVAVLVTTIVVVVWRWLSGRHKNRSKDSVAEATKPATLVASPAASDGVSGGGVEGAVPPKLPVQVDSLFESTIPQELKTHVFSFLTAEELAVSSLVCRNWRILIRHASFWQEMFERDKTCWTVMEGGALNINDWREKYLHHHVINKQVAEDELRSSTQTYPPSSQPKAIRDTKLTCPVLILGSRLLFYPILNSENPAIVKTELFPGIQGVGSGVGVRIDGREMQLCVMYKTKNEDIFRKIWPIWRSFLAQAKGIIYVVKAGSDTSIEEDKRELHGIHNNSFTTPHSPLLVVALGGDDKVNWKPAELVERLDLATITTRKWLVNNVDPTTLSGLVTGLSWLAHNLV